MTTNRSVGESLNQAIARAGGEKKPRHGRATAAGGFQTGWNVERTGNGDEKICDKVFILVSRGKVKLHRKLDGQNASKCLAAADVDSFDEIRNALKKHFDINLPANWHSGVRGDATDRA